jgi:ACS family tartrate transporter-like MFS transporter
MMSDKGSAFSELPVGNHDQSAGASALSKATWRILPLIALGYGIAFIDRANISFAALQMNRDLHFSATIYGLGGGLFFLSYALFEIPSNLLLVKFGARRWIARIMITWGLIAAGMMFVRSPMQFYVMRFLLGLAEAGFFPGVIYYLTFWFPSDVRGRAISRFYVAWPLSTVIMGALAGTLLGLQGRLGLAGWQWLFLLEGLPAVVVGIFVLFLLPERPADAKWLSTGEKQWLERRLQADLTSARRHADRGLFAALLNPVVVVFTMVNMIVLGSYYAFNLSAPEILTQATGLDTTTVGYVIAAGGIFGAVVMILFGWHSDHRKERFLHLAAPILMMAAAYGVLAMTRDPRVVICAYWLAIMSNCGIAAVFWLAPGELLAPRSLAVSIAAINAVGQLGSFVSPILWGMAKDATGSFHLALSLLPAGYLLAAALVLWLRSQMNIPHPAPAIISAEGA